jgi:predicted Zn-dependent protease
MLAKLLKSRWGFISISFLFLILTASYALASQESVVVKSMEKELNRCFEKLSSVQPHPLYYLGYEITEIEETRLSSSLGTIIEDKKKNLRYLDVDARVGNNQLDNTHEIRGEIDYLSLMPREVQISVEDNEAAIRQRLWLETEKRFKEAQDRYTKVLTNKAVKVEEEDLSDDFSIEEPQIYVEEPAKIEFDPAPWKAKLRKFSQVFKEYPEILNSTVFLGVKCLNRYIVNSEGTRIQTGDRYVRLHLSCQGKADDGMELRRSENFDADDPDKLPTDEEVLEAIHRMVNELLALKEAPLVEPYAGPAILVNRASGVFFHEIFGHRIEGHRQKSEMEGQTFAKKVGEKILPEFISVYDDATKKEYNGTFLRGYYKYDDEGVKSQKVTVVEDGVLKNFLMSRSPVEGFLKSNGHGRREYGRQVVARQGNLIVESQKTVSYDRLKEMLIEECKEQGKPCGLIFEDIAGGFTTTQRYGPQTFKVIPLLVYRVYSDGRPDEVVRGVDIVGTPLASFTKIIATGDDYDVFNGTCGAESGWVPVSAVSPSILVSEIEVEKKMKGQEKPPILPPPYK